MISSLYTSIKSIQRYNYGILLLLTQYKALLMKALQYVETEVMLNEDGTLIEGRPTEALSLIDCVMPDVVLARQKKLRERVQEEKLK